MIIIKTNIPFILNFIYYNIQNVISYQKNNTNFQFLKKI